MEAKMFEIRDSATFIAALAVDMNSSDGVEGYLLSRAGYANDNHPIIMLTRADGGGLAHYDPHGWGGRTWPVAHDYIEKHWHQLESGDVVDVEFILGESAEKKSPERFSYPP